MIYRVKRLYPGKITMNELEFLKSKGWKFITYDCIGGEQEVEINMPDQYTVIVNMGG